MKRKDKRIKEVMEWFKTAVSYKGEPFVIDYEQAVAVADTSLNMIVVARAGSGKTRTLVAKIVYLVSVCGVKPEEIIAFVFNTNAATEINERLSEMRVNGKQVIDDIKIASTFHAFSRQIVYGMRDGRAKCGEILAERKDEYVLEIVRRMMKEEKWRILVLSFIKGVDGCLSDDEFYGESGLESLSDSELEKFAAMMVQFINRAQQRYLGGKMTVGEVAKKYLNSEEVLEREEIFIRLGVEVFRRYHWYLLNSERGLKGFSEYGTDFNLIVSWASKLIKSGRQEIREMLANKKYMLIDEYQDFSQLFLAEIKAIREVARGAKLFVVGDDWQAINRFAGSDVEYFKEFEKYFPTDVKRAEITTNYRCDREVVDKARKFMKKAMKEKGNFKAFSRKFGKVMVMNPRETEVGFALVPYDLRISVEDRLLREAVWQMDCVVVNKKMVRYLKVVVELVKKNLKAKDILFLHRNNEMNIGGLSLEKFGKGLRWALDRLNIMNCDEFDNKVKIMTMHKSKGLEAEVVIILEADEGVIPKTHPDTLLYRMFGETEGIALNDQKRLFYVAMTRAKKRLYIISEGGGFVKYLGKTVAE
ncbi:ATP-dependent helicase [Candidatus Saccharibacteria bacterium]|nr:ATP-dependent helicase [Candidatus Saccharibacteria bacterium]